MSNNVKSETAKNTHKIPVIDLNERVLKTIECEARVVEIREIQRTNYVFHCIKNPLPHTANNSYCIVDVKSGYVLAFGATEKAALQNAKKTISELASLSDIGARITFQQKLNKSFSSI